MSDPKNRPYWLPYIVLPLLITVGTMLSFVYLSFKHQDVVVQDDWDEDSAAVNAAIEREHEAVKLGLKATIISDTTTGDISLDLKGKLSPLPASLKLKISHATDASRDQLVALTRQADGKYHGMLGRVLDGRYYLAIDQGNWRLTDMRTFHPDPRNPQTSVDIVAGP